MLLTAYLQLSGCCIGTAAVKPSFRQGDRACRATGLECHARTTSAPTVRPISAFCVRLINGHSRVLRWSGFRFKIVLYVMFICLTCDFWSPLRLRLPPPPSSYFLLTLSWGCWETPRERKLWVPQKFLLYWSAFCSAQPLLWSPHSSSTGFNSKLSRSVSHLIYSYLSLVCATTPYDKASPCRHQWSAPPVRHVSLV